jgi:F420-non-reducing hydrogenase small subunit
MPCRGGFGPTPDALDQGTKLLAALGAITSGVTREEAIAVAESLPDPLGTLYRFSLPSSVLHRKGV